MCAGWRKWGPLSALGVVGVVALIAVTMGVTYLVSLKATPRESRIARRWARSPFSKLKLSSFKILVVVWQILTQVRQAHSRVSGCCMCVTRCRVLKVIFSSCSGLVEAIDDFLGFCGTTTLILRQLAACCILPVTSRCDLTGDVDPAPLSFKLESIHFEGSFR